MSEHDHLANSSHVHVWDGPLRIFHWLPVLSIVVAFLSSEEDSPINQWHMISGWFAAILIAFRMAGGFFGGGRHVGADSRESYPGDGVRCQARRDNPGTDNARKPSLFAYLIGAAVITAARFSILMIDPQAFVPRSTESAKYEWHRTWREMISVFAAAGFAGLQRSKARVLRRPTLCQNQRSDQ